MNNEFYKNSYLRLLHIMMNHRLFLNSYNINFNTIKLLTILYEKLICLFLYEINIESVVIHIIKFKIKSKRKYIFIKKKKKKKKKKIFKLF